MLLATLTIFEIQWELTIDSFRFLTCVNVTILLLSFQWYAKNYCTMIGSYQTWNYFWLFYEIYFRPTHFAESFANANAEIQSVFRMRIKYWKCINLLIISPNFAKLAHTAPRKWEVLPLNYTYKLVQLLLNILSLMELIIHWVPPEFCNNFLDFYMFF